MAPATSHHVPVFFSPSFKVAHLFAPATSPATARAYPGFMRIDGTLSCSRCIFFVLHPIFQRIYSSFCYPYEMMARPCPFIALSRRRTSLACVWDPISSSFSCSTLLHKAPMAKPLYGKRPNEEVLIALCSAPAAVVQPRPLAPRSETSGWGNRFLGRQFWKMGETFQAKSPVNFAKIAWFTSMRYINGWKSKSSRKGVRCKLMMAMVGFVPESCPIVSPSLRNMCISKTSLLNGIELRSSYVRAFSRSCERVWESSFINILRRVVNRCLNIKLGMYFLDIVSPM